MKALSLLLASLCGCASMPDVEPKGPVAPVQALRRAYGEYCRASERQTLFRGQRVIYPLVP